MMPQDAAPKRYGLFVLAVLLLLAGGAALYVGSHNFALRILGLASIVASTYLVRASHVHGRSHLPAASDERSRPRAGSVLWIVSIALLPVAGASYLYLYNDALHGSHEALPVYVFAGVGLACTLVWSYLISRIFR